MQRQFHPFPQPGAERSREGILIRLDDEHIHVPLTVPSKPPLSRTAGVQPLEEYKPLPLIRLSSWRELAHFLGACFCQTWNLFGYFKRIKIGSPISTFAYGTPRMPTVTNRINLGDSP